MFCERENKDNHFHLSRQVIKYFEETHGLNVRDLDAKLQSPLHIACTCGHLDLFTFLIKHDVS